MYGVPVATGEYKRQYILTTFWGNKKMYSCGPKKNNHCPYFGQAIAG
jgi:hypothetical protein